MGKRSTARRLAMQALFQADISKDINSVLDTLLEEEEFLDETKDFARKLASGAIEKLSEVDEAIKKYSQNWSFDRLNNVDKSILRLSIYELLYLKENPPSVVINEAIELAKKYSEEESAKFINGILGSIVASLKSSR